MGVLWTACYSKSNEKWCLWACILKPKWYPTSINWKIIAFFKLQVLPAHWVIVSFSFTLITNISKEEQGHLAPQPTIFWVKKKIVVCVSTRTAARMHFGRPVIINHEWQGSKWGNRLSPATFVANIARIQGIITVMLTLLRNHVSRIQYG